MPTYVHCQTCRCAYDAAAGAACPACPAAPATVAEPAVDTRLSAALDEIARLRAAVESLERRAQTSQALTTRPRSLGGLLARAVGSVARALVDAASATALRYANAQRQNS